MQLYPPAFTSTSDHFFIQSSHESLNLHCLHHLQSIAIHHLMAACFVSSSSAHTVSRATFPLHIAPSLFRAGFGSAPDAQRPEPNRVAEDPTLSPFSNTIW